MIYERNCHGFIARWFARRGWGAVTLPLPFVTLILYWHWTGPNVVPSWIRRHELCHAEQARRMTWIGFYLRYFWLLLRDGYARHPMEIEARNHE